MLTSFDTPTVGALVEGKTLAVVNPLVEIEEVIIGMLKTTADQRFSTFAVLALYSPQPPAIVAIEHIYIWSVGLDEQSAAGTIL